MRAELYENTGSLLILVISKSGQGKSTAIRNLPPETTHIINVMGKPLPFIGGLTKYKVGQNMDVLVDASNIIHKMIEVSKKPNIEHLVIDDGQYIMAAEFMRQALVKGYDKFTIMANNMWKILMTANQLKPGMRVFFLTHEEETPTERKMKTLGKLLDEKLTPEGLSTIVLFGGVSGDATMRTYYFQTQSDGICNAKSPLGMFPYYIPNDLWLVSQRIEEYYSGVELKDSKLDLTVQFEEPKERR